MKKTCEETMEFWWETWGHCEGCVRYMTNLWTKYKVNASGLLTVT